MDTDEEIEYGEQLGIGESATRDRQNGYLLTNKRIIYFNDGHITTKTNTLDYELIVNIKKGLVNTKFLDKKGECLLKLHMAQEDLISKIKNKISITD